MSNANNMNSHCDPVISNLRVAGSIPAAPTSFCLNPPNTLGTLYVGQESPVEKLPVTPKFNDYLRAQIRFLLLNIDEIKRYQGHLRGAVQDRLRDLARELRNSKGFSNWYAVIFGAICFGLMGLIAYSHQPRIYTFVAPADTFRVIAQDSDFNFILQQVHVGVPQKEAVYHFCPSQPMPRFQVGMTLDQLVYEEKGDCQQLAKGIAYIIERDETLPGHWPRLPPNCVNLGVGKPVVCDGKPKF